ncbi:MAG: hypothetical protein ABIF06_01840 [bacterium]
MEILGYKFEGAFDHNELFTTDFGCVYALIDANYQLVDVGQTNSVNDRIPNHNRKNCWVRNDCPGKNLFIHRSEDEAYRLQLEGAIRSKYSPACGVK